MTWAEMTSEQRDRLVAEKVMGWQAKECDGEIGEKPISSDGWFCMRCGHDGYWGDDFTHEEKPPHYTQSLDAAWLIMDKLKPGRAKGEPIDDADFLVRSRFVSRLDDGLALWCMTKEQVCEAICRYALYAVGIEID